MFKELSENLNQSLQKAAKMSINNAETILEFSTNSIPDHKNYSVNIQYYNDHYIKAFEKLNTNRVNPSIYWFEVEWDEECIRLKSLLLSKAQELKNQEDKRVTPPQNRNKQSKVLYVGSRKGGYRKRDGLTNIAGRIIQHFGFYEKGSTGSLQFVHWCKTESVNVRLKVVDLVNMDNRFSTLIEKEISNQLRPLLGQHK